MDKLRTITYFLRVVEARSFAAAAQGVDLTPSALSRAIASLEVRSSDNKSVLSALKRIPEVSRVWSTNGRWDLVVEIRTGDLTTLDRVLTEIRTNRAITHSETSILLAEVG